MTNKRTGVTIEVSLGLNLKTRVAAHRIQQIETNETNERAGVGVSWRNYPSSPSSTSSVQRRINSLVGRITLGAFALPKAVPELPRLNRNYISIRRNLLGAEICTRARACSPSTTVLPINYHPSTGPAAFNHETALLRNHSQPTANFFFGVDFLRRRLAIRRVARVRSCLEKRKERKKNMASRSRCSYELFNLSKMAEKERGLRLELEDSQLIEYFYQKLINSLIIVLIDE